MPHTDSEITLARDALLVLDDAQGVGVAVDAGVIWLTLHKDPRDVFVGAGERFRIDRPGRTVIMAHEPATLRIVRPRARALRAFASATDAIGAVIMRLRRALRSPAQRTVPYY